MIEVTASCLGEIQTTIHMLENVWCVYPKQLRLSQIYVILTNTGPYYNKQSMLSYDFTVARITL